MLDFFYFYLSLDSLIALSLGDQHSSYQAYKFTMIFLVKGILKWTKTVFILLMARALLSSAKTSFNLHSFAALKNDGTVVTWYVTKKNI